MHFEEPLFEGRDQENVCVSFHGSLDLESTSLRDFIPSSHPAPLDSLLQQMLEEANVNDNLPLYSRMQSQLLGVICYISIMRSLICPMDHQCRFLL